MSVFALHKTDTGSAAVQIELLNREVVKITHHVKKHKKDFSSTRGLVNKVHHMYKLMKYLYKKNPNQYYTVISTLNIKDIMKRKAN